MKLHHNYPLCVKLNTGYNIRQDASVRSPFGVHCQEIPLCQKDYTSAATDASDLYEVRRPSRPKSSLGLVVTTIYMYILGNWRRDTWI